MECLRSKFAGGVLIGGRYQTISPLNHGSFGMVFMAQDTVTNQNVAIKCMTKQPAANEAGVEFAYDEKSEELVLHSRLGIHANIVSLIDHFETDAHVYLVLEFCSQGDLYEAIRHGHGPLETEHVRDFMLQLVDAVSYIHSKGVYHRDIKPENIFLSQDGIMKLGDFGLATTDKWSYEMTVGSDRYMAPEQFDSAGAGYSPAEADIWAIGVCLLNILFSRNPFTTPTEADPLFLDFSRDKQSLFDVFPSMSQDTYEVIVQCMNMDPKRRSLVGARAALMRAVSFTTEDELLDDFCGAEKANVASANREPLRTPSIQSPQVDTGAFPWTKALHVSPHRRQLSAIPDNESYTEDLFSKSGATADWCSAAAQTPSMASVLGSHLESSMKSLNIDRLRRPSFKKVSPMAGSLPIAMGKPMTLSMSSVFGRRNEAVSKSWSDMWEEDEEEEQELHVAALKQQLNSRTWSHESKEEKHDTVPAVHGIKGDVDDDLMADGFFFQEEHIPAKPQAVPATPRYSPPSKRDNFDKWSVLGERRRAQAQSFEAEKSPAMTKHRRIVGLGYKSYEAGVWDHSNYHNKFWGTNRVKDSPMGKGRDWNWRRDRRTDFGDIEWVGGW
jgi:serine/threonine protein kinase